MISDAMDIMGSNPAHARMARKRNAPTRRATCANGLYLAPASGATLDSSQKMQIKWDNTCFSPAPSQVDIYLVAPYNTNSQIYTWYSVDYKNGEYDVDLKPKWWNATSSIQMQFNIVSAGDLPFLTDFPSGPLFTVNYNASTTATNEQAAAAANTAVPDSPYTTVNNSYQSSGLNKGQLAAAVLFPLLAVFGGLAVYVYLSRKKEKVKRQRWSQAVDKRMSTISTDWKSMSGAAANHAIRHSMAISGDRGTKASSFFAGSGPRPSSTFSSVEPGQAGVGARYGGVGLAGNLPETDMSQIRRPAPVNTNPAARVSRVSFADNVHPRPSMGDSLRTSVYTQGTRVSRAFHRGTVYGEDEDVPPVPTRPEDIADIHMSPTQTEGPAPLTPSEIRAKIGAASNDAPRPSIDEGLLKMPAMTLMRTSEGSNDMVLSPTTPVDYPVLRANTTPSPPPVQQPAASPVPATFAGMIPMHDNGVSPDAMLKAYAAKKASQIQPKRSQTFRAELTTSANGGMRVLYEPPANSSIPTVEESAYDEDAYSQGYASYYGGTTGHGHTDSYGTDEAVVTYGQRTTLSPRPDTNPFRKSAAVSGAFSEGSRYSGVEPGEAK